MSEKTQKNMMDAFAGESQANRSYLAYALAADKEGFPQVAKLFRAVAEAETIHALAHFRNAGKVKSTLENLKTAKAGEVHESTHMYPQMLKEAEEEGQKTPAMYFNYANEVEKVHAKLYQKAIDAQGKTETVDYYVCSVCGYTHEGPHDGPCPICKAAAQSFRKMD